MNFNTLTFVFFFLIVYALYLGPGSWTSKKWLLVIASYIFYGWWNPYYVVLLLGSTVANHAFAQWMVASSDQRRRRHILIVCVAANLAVLGVFKYFNFFSDNVAAMLGAFGMQADFVTLQVLLPIGISFFTFEAISYVADVYMQRLKPARSFLDYTLFVSFFPHLVAGPIVRARDFLPQIGSPRVVTAAHLESGITWIVLGYFFKIGVADNLASSVDYVFTGAGSAHPLELWLGVNYFAMQIFGDFFGYTLIARGLARLMGIDLVENFRYPYIATGIGDFWRRWHISLSSWLRDYLYIPLGGSHNGTAMTYRNLMITMLLGGLWHGAAWTFIAWGAFHGAFLVAERMLAPLVPQSGAFGRLLAGRNLAVHMAKILLTYVIVLISWVFFRADNIGQAFSVLRGMFDVHAMLHFEMPNKSLLKDGIWMVPAVIYFAWGLYKERAGRIPVISPYARMAMLGVLAFIAITCREASDAFIYFQF